MEQLFLQDKRIMNIMFLENKRGVLASFPKQGQDGPPPPSADRPAMAACGGENAPPSAMVAEGGVGPSVVGSVGPTGPSPVYSARQSAGMGRRGGRQTLKRRTGLLCRSADAVTASHSTQRDTTGKGSESMCESMCESM